MERFKYLSVIFLLIYYPSLCISATLRHGKSGRLPRFANDNSECFIASVIERSFDSQDLHLVTFLVGHKALRYMPQLPFLFFNKSESMNSWRRAASLWQSPHDNEMNMTDSGITCRLQNNLNSSTGAYETKAYWLPDTTTQDPGFNRNIEIMRCKILNTADVFNVLQNPSSSSSTSSTSSSLSSSLASFGSAKLSVEIFRGKTLLIRYKVPWATRQTGYGFSISRSASRFDAWSPSLSTPTHPIVHICSPIIRPLEPFRMDTSLRSTLEWIEHNLGLGFHHMFLGFLLTPESKHYQRYRLALEPYIRSGKVSMQSMSSLIGYDDTAGFLGAILIDDYARWIHQLQCLYISKGMADHIAMLHSSEYLVVGPPPNIMTVGQLLVSVKEASIKHEQEPCYYVIKSLGVPDPPSIGHSFGPADGESVNSFFGGRIGGGVDMSKPIGPLPAWSILIASTRKAWIVAWHVAGACAPSSDEAKALLKNRDNVNIIDDTGIPWSSARVSHETHAFEVPWNASELLIRHSDHGKNDKKNNDNDARGSGASAVIYFYRGHFEPWQLARPKHSVNSHLSAYFPQTVHRMTSRGVSFLKNEKGHVVQITLPLEAAKRISPHATSYVMMKSLPHAISYFGNVALISVNVSCSPRASNSECHLPASSGWHLIPDVPIGRVGLLAAGTWIECNAAKGCKYPADILLG